MGSRTFDISRYAPEKYHAFRSLEDFLAEPIREGISEILVGYMPLHIMFRDRGSDTTLVHFHAALPSSGYNTYPVFPGLPTASRLGVNHLSLSDPNFRLPGRVDTGWFSGSLHQDLQGTLARVIRHATKAGVEDQAVLFGSSAGGFAALYYGAQLPGSVTICANPRVELGNRPTSFFRNGEYAFPGMAQDDLAGCIDTSAAIPHAEAAGNTVAYIQNVQDKPYFENNMIPFLDQVGKSDLIWLNLVDSGPKHRMPEPRITKAVLASLFSAAPNWGEALQELGYLQAPSTADALLLRSLMLGEDAVNV